MLVFYTFLKRIHVYRHTENVYESYAIWVIFILILFFRFASIAGKPRIILALWTCETISGTTLYQARIRYNFIRGRREKRRRERMRENIPPKSFP